MIEFYFLFQNSVRYGTSFSIRWDTFANLIKGQLNVFSVCS